MGDNLWSSLPDPLILKFKPTKNMLMFLNCDLPGRTIASGSETLRGGYGFTGPGSKDCPSPQVHANITALRVLQRIQNPTRAIASGSDWCKGLRHSPLGRSVFGLVAVNIFLWD